MRKLIILIVLVTLANTGFCQLEKGKIIISGASNLSFVSQKVTKEVFSYGYGYSNNSSNSTITDETDNLNFNCALGYFITNKIALIADAEYTKTSRDFGDITSSSILGGARAYIDLGKVAKLYTQGGIGLIGMKFDSEYGPESDIDTGFAFGLGAGVALFVNKHLSIDLGYNYKKGSVDNSEVVNSGFSAGFSFYF